MTKFYYGQMAFDSEIERDHYARHVGGLCAHASTNPTVTAFDQVEHPSHYTSGPIECWDAMISAFGKEEMAIYLKITAFKYNWRAGKKGPAPVDFRKGVQCLNKAAELMEEKP